MYYSFVDKYENYSDKRRIENVPRQWSIRLWGDVQFTVVVPHKNKFFENMYQAVAKRDADNAVVLYKK